MSKALILNIATLVCAFILGVLGAKDDIKWPIINTTFRGWLMITFLIATIGLSICSYVASLKNAEITFIYTPSFTFERGVEEQIYNIPIYNSGERKAKEVSLKVQTWIINPDQTISFIDINERRLSDIPELSTLKARETISTQTLNNIIIGKRGLLLYYEVSYKDGESVKTEKTMTWWREGFGAEFALVSDEKSFNKYLNQIVNR